MDLRKRIFTDKIFLIFFIVYLTASIVVLTYSMNHYTNNMSNNGVTTTGVYYLAYEEYEIIGEDVDSTIEYKFHSDYKTTVLIIPYQVYKYYFIEQSSNIIYDIKAGDLKSYIVSNELIEDHKKLKIPYPDFQWYVMFTNLNINNDTIMSQYKIEFDISSIVDNALFALTGTIIIGVIICLVLILEIYEKRKEIKKNPAYSDNLLKNKIHEKKWKLETDINYEKEMNLKKIDKKYCNFCGAEIEFSITNCPTCNNDKK